MGAVSGVYTVTRPTAAVASVNPMLQVATPANCAIEVVRVWASQTDVETSEQCRIQVIRLTAAATVTSATPTKLSDGMQASKCVGGTGATGITGTTTGTASDIFYEDGFNALNGWLYLPVPEERIQIGPSEFIGVRFPTAPSATPTWTMGITFLEYSY